MYGKIFESIYDGTLAEDWRALITFQQFIILSDADGMVDMTSESISRRTGIPIEHIKSGIDILEKVDQYSRTPDMEGRRIELIDDHRPWGWHIVNHEKYKNLSDIETIREQTRNRVRRHREKKLLNNCNVTSVTGNASNAKKRHIDTDKDINTNKPKKESGNKFSDADMNFSIHMISKIRELNPNAKQPNLDSWSNTIRLMREQDDRSKREIQDVFEWANKDSFWQTNILSPATLRKQFDKLTMQSKRGSNEKNTGSHSGSFNATLEGIAKRAYDKGCR